MQKNWYKLRDREREREIEIERDRDREKVDKKSLSGEKKKTSKAIYVENLLCDIFVLTVTTTIYILRGSTRTT